MSFFLSHQRAIPWKYLAVSFFVSNIIPIFAFRYHRWYVFNWKYNNFISFYQSHPNIFHAVPGLQEQDWLYGSDQLYAAKYLTYMPSRTDLRREIEQQKEFFLLQHKGENKD